MDLTSEDGDVEVLQVVDMTEDEDVDPVRVLDAAAVALVVVDRDATITYANDPLADLTGVGAEELVGSAFDHERWKARDRAGRLVWRDTHPLGRALGGEHCDGEELIIDSPRGTRVLRLSASPLRDAEGTITHALATVQDVTDAAGLAARVDSTEARFAAVFDHAIEAMLLFDDDGRYVQVNPAAGRLLGRDPEDLLGRHYTEILADATDTEANWSDLMQVGVREELVDLLRSDGSVVTVAAQSVAAVEAGVHLTVWRDVTEQRRTTEALEQAVVRERQAADEQNRITAMKDVFLSAVSHELRTPLTAIAGFNETVRTHAGRLDGDAAAHLLERQHEHILRLQHLLDDLLDLDRLRRGLVVVEPVPVQLDALVEAAVEEVDAAGPLLTVEVAPVRVVVDEAKVRRIVANLVANARKHTPVGTRVEVRGTLDDGTVVLEVEDDGPGMAPELRDVAFEMFVKGTGEHARTSGTGVGLGLVRQFARLLGGDAELGRGRLGGMLVRVTFPSHQEASTQA